MAALPQAYLVQRIAFRTSVLNRRYPSTNFLSAGQYFVKVEDDTTLVLRCREGDRDAFEQLVVRYQRPVFNVALRMLRNRQDALDVAQTAFLKAFEHLGDYDPSFRFYSWLYRIAINESLNALALRKPLGQLDAHTADEGPDPDRVAEGEQTLDAIEDALMTVSPELRTVLILRHITQLSYEEIAETLGLPEKTVKSRLHSARERLREQLRPVRSDLT